MEVTGVQRIFSRSIETNKLRYTEYHGDGDSKSFNEVENVSWYCSCEERVYWNCSCEERVYWYCSCEERVYWYCSCEERVYRYCSCEEGIGHVQKRVGTRLRKLKKTEKHLGNLGLVDQVIDRLQNYFDMAVRSNLGEIVKMKKVIYDAWCRVVFRKNIVTMYIALHELIVDWFTYQLDIENQTNLYLPGKGLPGEVIKHVKPIFESLSSDQPPSKCLHGKTQNQNEAYNALI